MAVGRGVPDIPEKMGLKNHKGLRLDECRLELQLHRLFPDKNVPRVHNGTSCVVYIHINARIDVNMHKLNSTVLWARNAVPTFSCSLQWYEKHL